MSHMGGGVVYRKKLIYSSVKFCQMDYLIIFDGITLSLYLAFFLIIYHAKLSVRL